MPEQNHGGLILREISPDDKVSGLSLNNSSLLPLIMFLKKDAKLHHKENASKSYVFVVEETKKVVAYITLICSQIELEEPPPGLRGYRYTLYPAIKIARLAVNLAQQNSKLGQKLVSLAIAIAKEKVMPHVGCRFLAVDSHKDAIPFYEKCGFRLLETETNRARHDPLMFIDLGKLE